jgi:transcriptional regulator with XRE-family HTH domain
VTPGEKLRELRLAKALKQSDLAEVLGVTTNTVWVWENYPSRRPSRRNKAALARALGCREEDIWPTTT